MTFPKVSNRLHDFVPKPPYLHPTFTNIPQRHLPMPATPKFTMCHALKNLLSTIFWYTMLAIAITALIHTLVAFIALCAYACRVEGGVCILLFISFMVACTTFSVAFFLFLCGIDVFGIDEAMPWVD